MTRPGLLNKGERGKGLLSVWIFWGLLGLNAFLVSPYLGWYDSGEMVGATLCLGISHPSGQVLFHLLGKIFLLIPWGTPAYKIGLLSASCSALGSVLFFNLSLKLAGSQASLRIKLWLTLLTLAWSLSLPWWRYSLMPLVYALHLLLGLLVLWVLSLEKPHRWPLVFLILGCATVFRPTQFFALPWVGLAFLNYLFNGAGNNQGKSLYEKLTKNQLLVFLSLLAFILGRSTAFYLPLRSALGPELAYGSLTHFGDFFRHLFALRFSSFVGEVNHSTSAGVLVQMFSHFWRDLAVVGLALALGGLALAIREKKRMPVFLWVGLAWGAMEALFVFTIPFPTFESHQMLLGWVFSGLFGALSLIHVEQWAGRDEKRSLALGGLLILWVLVQALSLGHLWDRKKERGAQDYAKNILELLPEGALYIPAEENEFFPVVGYQQSFQFKKNVELVEPGAKPEAVSKKINDCLREGRPLFVSRKWPLPPGWTFQSLGPLLRVGRGYNEPAPRKLPAGLKPLAQWGKISLAGASITPSSVRAGGRVEITYRWFRGGPSACDQTQAVVGLFTDPHGNYWVKNGVFWFHDIHEGPLGGLARMNPGYEYEEKRILFVPSDFTPGRYRLSVGLQKLAARREMGRESYGREFYERSGDQNLDKFIGRGEDGAMVQFSAESSQAPDGDQWWPSSPGGSRFVPAAELEILPPDDQNP